MFNIERLGETKKQKYKYKLEQYVKIRDGICEITNDKVIDNQSIEYLQGFQDALDLEHARLCGLLHMTGISEACLIAFIHMALRDIDSNVKMSQTWIDRILDAMECYEASLHMGDYMNEPQ